MLKMAEAKKMVWCLAQAIAWEERLWKQVWGLLIMHMGSSEYPTSEVKT